jgi:hypothetical protein
MNGLVLSGSGPRGRDFTTVLRLDNLMRGPDSANRETSRLLIAKAGIRIRITGKSVPCYTDDNSLFRYPRECGIEACKQCIFNGIADQLAGPNLRGLPVFFPFNRDYCPEGGSHVTLSSANEPSCFYL